MKIIDILNNIANGKPVPKKIRWNVLDPNFNVCIYDEEEQEYFFENDPDNYLTIPNHHLNDTVEIIEE